MIANKVKLVVWDLDDTFWTGTLLEGGIVPVTRNIEMVQTLSRRGIVNSICSKNDYEQAKAKLMELGIWDHFVFPSITFNPKGKAIAEMIEGAALRPENVLFIDDNRANLEEVKFFVPGVMTAHPADILDGLLEHEHLAGKPDPELTRLKQYQFLQRKVEERSTTALSNEEFLRVSNIRVTIDYDVAANFDRVLELINRTNQLNYTKVRLEDASSVARFRKLLRSYGITSGCVWVSDNYGDYGLAGFFMLKRRVAQTKLIHFAFSCRTMNMGIEQYVYELLGKPPVDIVQPVSYGLEEHTGIDWINAADASSRPVNAGKATKLVLLGGCDQLQLANYCSTDRLEFANLMRNGSQVRFDDPGFVLNDREDLRRHSEVLPTWTYEEACGLDEGLANAELILVGMYGALSGLYYRIGDSIQVRVNRGAQELHVEELCHAANIPVRCLDLDVHERTDLILKAFDAIDRKANKDAQIFITGYSSLGAENERKLAKRTTFIGRCKEFCAARDPRFRYVDVDEVVPREELLDGRHFSAAGFFTMARYILSTAGISGPALSAPITLSKAAPNRSNASGEPALAM